MAKVQDAVQLSALPELGLAQAVVVEQPLVVQGVVTSQPGVRSVRAPPGDLGLRFAGTTVTAVTRCCHPSPLLGVVDRGDVLLSVNGVAATAESFRDGRNIIVDAGGAPRTLVFQTKAPAYPVPRFPLPAELEVSVPPGPIGVRFKKCTVRKVLGTSTLGGRVQPGAVLLAVNGVPVTAASLDASPDILETSDDGTKLRTLTFAERPPRVDLSGFYKCHYDMGTARIPGRAIMCDFDACLCGLCLFPVPPFVMFPPYFCGILDSCQLHRDWEKNEEDKYVCDNSYFQLADRYTGNVTFRYVCSCVCTPLF